jgi:multidrug efflux pump subunit AcrB
VLTALAAILAMIPLSRSAFWARWRHHHGRPCCCNLLTLLYLPGLYALWFRKSLERRPGQPDRAATSG